MAASGRIKAKGTNKAYRERTVMKTWSNGELVRGKVPIDSLNYSLHYCSPTVWEGIRSYKQEDGSTKIWKLEEHATRLVDSAKVMGFKIPFSKEQIVQACKDVVEANGGGDLYIRPIAYALGQAESAKPQELVISLDIYTFPIKSLHKDKPGIKCIISSQPRSYPNYQMQAKSAENYSFLQKVKPEIRAANVDDAFLTDNQGYIVEATVANIFVVKGDIIYTPPNNGSILPGITRGCVAQILGNPQLMFSKYKKACTVLEKNITRADIYTADCVFICGTYAEIVKVIEVDGRNVDINDFYFRVVKDNYQKMIRGSK